jgi:hypothetical protein
VAAAELRKGSGMKPSTARCEFEGRWGEAPGDRPRRALGVGSQFVNTDVDYRQNFEMALARNCCHAAVRVTEIFIVSLIACFAC